MSETWMARHQAARDQMLTVAIDVLAGDERFVAAWLSGSIGRGNEDGLSDVDLTVVVADPHADRLCHRDHQVGAGTTPERLFVLSTVGEPALVHKNHYNAPSGGSFTDCVYTNGVIFDWIFVPVVTAIRPAETRLLFDSVGIPVQQPPAALIDAERLHQLSEQIAFFWMMVVPTTKVLLRGDLVTFQQLLEVLHRIADEVERLLEGALARYVRWSRAPFLTTPVERHEAVVAICRRVDASTPAAVAAGVAVSEKRWAAVGPWLEALRPTGR